jgi:hypothetical protein
VLNVRFLDRLVDRPTKDMVKVAGSRYRRLAVETGPASAAMIWSDILPQLTRETVKQAPDPARCPQVLMHDQPDSDPRQHEAGQHGHQLGAPSSDSLLAVADAKPGSQRCQQI